MHRRLFLCTAAVLAFAPVASRAADPLTLELPGGEGPGKGKHVVLLAGDEEYRSEEAMPMLAGVLSKRHGFKCTVLFSVNKDGIIDPNNGASLTGSAALDSADAIIMSLRFRHWDDEAMGRFDAAFKRGIPIVALRTSTHAFNFEGGSKWKSYSFNNDGGFGKKVLGETWVSHWGNHGPEGTRGIIEAANKDNAVLRGVTGVIGDTDVYEASPPADAVILLRGEVMSTQAPDCPPAVRNKKTREGKEQDVNKPMMPVAWTREHKQENGKVTKVLTTTMGAASDLKNEGLRRLLVNGLFWGLNMEVPASADVKPVGEFTPTRFGFNGYKKGVKPADTAPKE